MNEIGGVYRSQSKQWLAAFAATLTMVNVGNEEFWILKTVKIIADDDFASHMDEDLVIAGFFLVATSSVIGAILGGVLAERFGRKKTLLATSFFVISQILGSFSTNSVFSCVTLFLGEIGFGITRVVVPLYVSEIVDDNIRGALLMLQVPLFYLGKLIAVGIGNLVSAEALGVVSLISTGIFLLTFTRFPETPYYLASKKRDEVANRSLAFFRGVESNAAEDDVEVIVKKFEATGDSQRCNGKFQELLRPTNRKALFIIMLLVIFKWSEQIFESRNYMAPVVIGSVVSNNYHAYIIAHVTSLLASILIVFVIDIIGRRTLLVYSTFTGFILVIIAIILQSNPSFDRLYNAMAMILHLWVLIMFSIPLVYVGELFSANVRVLGITIVTTFNLLLSFVIISLPANTEINSMIGLILLLLASPLTYAFSPETKQKSYSEIQKELAITCHCRCMRKKSAGTDQSK